MPLQEPPARQLKLARPLGAIGLVAGLAIAACNSAPAGYPDSIRPLASVGAKKSPKPGKPASPGSPSSAKPQRTHDPNLLPPIPQPLFSAQPTSAPSATPTPTPAPTATASPPTLTSFTPTHASTGALVTLSGSHFSPSLPDNVVKFNGVNATVTVASATQLTVTVPVGATSGTLSVSVGGRTATSYTNFVVDPPPPSVSDFTPRLGPVGTSVTLTGSHFGATSAANSVRFNGQAAIVTAASATSLTVSVPAGATTGALTIAVGSASTNAGSFTVTP